MMISGNLKRNLLFLMLTLTFSVTFGQGNVPLGIHYQAVARDNYGKELASRKIDIMFSIISGNPIGTVVFQELHSNVITSKFGVFSLIIGHGTPTGGTFGELSQIEWDKAFHFLKVEVKFENDYVDMGTMQFLAVPYALFARKSLEPGPEGPKGDTGPAGPKGDPATDNQTLSVLPIDGSDYLAISGGNQVKISSIERDGDPANEIQDLIYDKAKMELSLLKSTAPIIDLSGLKNDADADPANEIQDLTYNTDNHQLSISKVVNPINIDPVIAFRAGIQSNVDLPNDTEIPIIFNLSSGNYYNDGDDYNNSTGRFMPPYNGIYTFNISINLPMNASVIFKVDGRDDERIISSYNSAGPYLGSVTMKLNPSNIVYVVVKQSNGYTIPVNFSGYFSGYRVY